LFPRSLPSISALFHCPSPCFRLSTPCSINYSKMATRVRKSYLCLKFALLTPHRHSFCESTSWLSLVEEVRTSSCACFPPDSKQNYRCRKVGFDDSVHSEPFRGRIRSYHRGYAHSHDTHVAAFQSFTQIRTANSVSLTMRSLSSTFSTPPVRRNTGEYFY